VGNTDAVGNQDLARAVHPHACGEHQLSPRQIIYKIGSSPRMWGTPLLRDISAILGRFIPTHVGNTSGISLPGEPLTVHPHACGEHAPGLGRVGYAHGSSPRMWGTPGGVCVYFPSPRFIPTHVGNTTIHWPLSVMIAVHPHACGEHVKLSPNPLPLGGSSPRMWGTPQEP